jgi:hypothetical protein
VTPDARAIWRAGAPPTNVTSTRWLGSSSVMLATLRQQAVRPNRQD